MINNTYNQDPVLKREKRDFSGSPVVNTLPSSGEGMVSVPGQESKIPYALGPKKKPKYKTEPILQQIQLKTLKTGLHLNRETSMETYTLPYVK